MHYYFTLKEEKWELVGSSEKDPRILYYGAGSRENIMVFSTKRFPPWRVINPNDPHGFWNINSIQDVPPELQAWALVLGE